MRDRIVKVMSNALGLAQDEINEGFSPETSEVWDSYRHILLVLSLEKEFKIKFVPEEIGELLCLKSIIEIVNNKKGE